MLRPRAPGTRLKLFGFWGPGLRAVVENRTPLEEDMSEVQTQLIGDTNFGFAEPSLLTDLRVFTLSFGVGVGYRYDWRNIQFEPDSGGRDHGGRRLDRDTREAKSDDADFATRSWPWVELRSRLVFPGETFMPVFEGAYRYEDRPDNSFDWTMATVFDSGWHWRVESFWFVRHWSFGFVGPAFRYLNLPRTDEDLRSVREHELHYGFVFGTSPYWGTSQDQILVRIYAAFGLDEHDLMGASFYQAPVQIVVGYQTEIDF